MDLRNVRPAKVGAMLLKGYKVAPNQAGALNNMTLMTKAAPKAAPKAEGGKE